ncbi:hypothetical protein ABT095_21020 [Kitasatospora sp. NPDC002227]|uniref:hypothetical protein n=1 Tax=Kitasatospora sp. NPDC002227 TaxID=3154773 RepID=UPI00332E7457
MRQRGIVVRPGVLGACGVILLAFLTSCAAATPGADRVAGSGTLAAPATPPPGAGGTALPPTDGPEGAVGRLALAVYQDWWNTKVAVFGSTDANTDQLGVDSTGKAFADSIATVRQLRAAKMVMTGTPRTSPVVKQLDLAAKPATATIEDCLDVSGWHQADAATRVVKDPPQRLNRYLSVVKLRQTEASWIVVDVTREVGKTC